jgi:glycosyltransferase involved in cell wall biosynthesis
MNASVQILSHALTAPPRVPQEGRARVYQLAPSLEVRGGVSSVVQIISDYLSPYVVMNHIPTMVEESLLRKGAVFARSLQTLRRVLASQEPAIFHIHFASRGSTLRKLILAEMVADAGRPLILHAHGARFDSFHRGLPNILRRRVNAALQRATAFIALSQQWREFFINECELSPSQITVLPNPVRWQPDVPNRAGRPFVQIVKLGRLSERKGSYDLVNAYAALPPEVRARARLVLAGDGDVEGVRKLAAPFGDSVRVLSWIGSAERDRLLAESDVFALPSHAEGLPMALLEAMACGLPAITTPVGGIPDVFSHGVEGLLVQPGRVDELSAAMKRLILDDAERLGCGARAHLRTRALDVHVYARRLADLYHRIAPVAEIREFA